jgi:hypothetical protein
MVLHDTLQDDRIQDLEARMRVIEEAVIELGILSKFVKYGVLLVAASFGLDLQAVV